MLPNNSQISVYPLINQFWKQPVAKVLKGSPAALFPYFHIGFTLIMGNIIPFTSTRELLDATSIFLFEEATKYRIV
jgi:hypothetical protein